MESALIVLGVVGLVMMLIGRLMLWAVAAHMGPLWIVAVRFLPLGDIAFLMRHWEVARNGAITSLVGMALIMPLIASTLTNRFQSRPDSVYVEDDGDYMESAYMLPTPTVSKASLIHLKGEKVDALNNYLSRWYQLLQSRRQAVVNEGPVALQQYNKDAAAYQQLLAVAKDESLALEKLKAEKQ